LRFFSDEYDEVCSTVIPSLNDVLSFLRKSAKDGPSSPQRAVMLLPILRAVFAKMRYDDTASWEGDEEQDDEAEFQDLRKRLDVLQQTISGADERLYSDALSGLVDQAFDDLRSQGEQLNWRDLELALHEMFLFGDLAIKTGGLYQKSKPNSPAAERLVRMMLKMIESGKLGVPSPPSRGILRCTRLTTLSKTSRHSITQRHSFTTCRYAFATAPFLKSTRGTSHLSWSTFSPLPIIPC